MANEEQRRAFALYMGTTNTGNNSAQNQDQPTPYPGAVARPANLYLYNVWALLLQIAYWISQQFPGVGQLPAAPTPPLSTASSTASSLPFPNNVPGIGLGIGQGTFGPGNFPSRPPPLGSSHVAQGQAQQFGQPQAGYYSPVSNNLNFQSAPPPPIHNGALRGMDLMSAQDRRLSGLPARPFSSPMQYTGNNMDSHSRHQLEFSHYQENSTPSMPAPPPQGSDTSTPVMLCHTCSHCGRLRSAGYHRHHPVVPGKNLVPSPCRKCKKKIKNRRYCSITRMRTCTAKEPCDWPREPLHVDYDYVEHRGRRRDRDSTRSIPDYPRIIRRSSSQINLGLRAFQQSPRRYKPETRIRVSSLSPKRPTRYGEIWPPPDVVLKKPITLHSPPPPMRAEEIRRTRQDGVWPPPDVVQIGSHGNIKRSSSLSYSNRVVELSPSPPPTRTKSRTRVVHERDSRETRRRSPSLSHVRLPKYDSRRSTDAENRLAAHPRAYRAVIIDDEPLRDRPRRSESRLPKAPLSPILKAPSAKYESSRLRRDVRDSTEVETGGPRVHFIAERRDYDEDREHFEGEDHRSYRASRGRHIDTEEPAEYMERLRIRHSSRSPIRRYDDEIHVERRRAPSPRPSRRDRPYEETAHIRYVSPPPPRGRTRRNPPSPPPERRNYSGYRYVTPHHDTRDDRSPSPLRIRKKPSQDFTDSESAHSEIVEVRTWKGIDENGQPATFVEETTTTTRQPRMIESGDMNRTYGLAFEAVHGSASGSVREGVWRDV